MPTRISVLRWSGGLAFGTLCLAALAACGGSPTVGEPLPTAVPTLNRTVYVQGLDNPWDIAFHTDGTMFYTEKCLGLSVRRADGSTTRLFGAGGSLPAADLVCESQSGMLGVALDPNFASNRRIYVFMASNLSTSPRTNRVVRLELNAGYTSAGNRRDIVTDIAFKDVPNAISGVGMHSGGRIRFGPDGYLYIGTGDNHSPTLPQHPTMLGGKVLRVTTDGAAAPGNTPPSGFDPRIYTYGHRNVQGIAFRPGTGQAFVAEHGPNHSDEVTPLVNGGNGGWDPKDRPALTCPDGYCGYAGTASTMPMTDVARFPNAMLPSFTNNNQSQGMGPLTFLTGARWGLWGGRLLVGIMGGKRLVLLELDAAGTAVSNEDLDVPAARYRALVQRPDGDLYIVTDAGQIWRIAPELRGSTP